MVDPTPAERCVVCNRSDQPATPASGKGADKAWLCADCSTSRFHYGARNDRTVLDSIAWAARTARAKAFEEAAKVCGEEAINAERGGPSFAARVLRETAQKILSLAKAQP